MTEGGDRRDDALRRAEMSAAARRAEAAEAQTLIDGFVAEAGRRGLAPVPVIMTTALSDPKTVIRAFHDGVASGYLVKPVAREKLFAELVKLGLVEG